MRVSRQVRPVRRRQRTFEGQFQLASGADSGSFDTPAQEAIWARWLSDYNANPTTPATRGGKWFKAMKGFADESPSNPVTSLGGHAAWVHRVTGNTSYVAKAVADLTNWQEDLPPRNGNWNDPFAWDANYVRVQFGRLIRAGLWLWDGMTQAQRDFWFGFVVDNVERHVMVYAGGDGVSAPYQGWPLGDSDQVMGVWFQVAMLALMFPGTSRPGNARVQAMWNLAKTGGLASTASNRTTTARNAIRYYIELAVGGEFIESAAYNVHTIQFLMEGHQAISNFTGVDYFPEATAWYPDYAVNCMSSVLPGRAMNHKWGDEEIPDTFLIYEWSPTLAFLCGLLKSTARGRQLQGLINDLCTQHGEVGSTATMQPNLNLYHQVYAYDDTTTADAYTGLSEVNYFFASGVGIQRHRTGWGSSDWFFGMDLYSRWPDAEFGTWGPDHHVRMLQKWQLWRGSDELIDQHHTYFGASHHGMGTCGPLMHGLGDCWEYKKLRAWNTASTHAFSTATTGGSLVAKDVGSQPPVVVHEFTRSLLYVPGTTPVVIAHDRAYVDNIAGGDLATYPGTSATYDGQEEGFIFRKRARKQWPMRVPTNPTVSGEVATWTDPENSVRMKTACLTATGTSPVTYSTVDLRGGLGNPSASTWPNTPPYEYGWHPTNLLEAEADGKYVWQYLSNNTWDAFVQVTLAHPTTTPATPTYLNDAGDANGCHVVRTGESDVVALFNSTQGAALNTTAYHASHEAALNGRHLHGAKTITASWTASNATTELYLPGLNPALSWTLSVDGGAANSISPAADGFYRTTVSGTGAHTITVVGA